MSETRRRQTPRLATRLRWLLACAFAGALVAAVGHAWTGSQAWTLALPAAIACGWLFFGTPHECAPPEAGPGEPRAPHDAP